MLTCTSVDVLCHVSNQEKLWKQNIDFFAPLFSRTKYAIEWDHRGRGYGELMAWFTYYLGPFKHFFALYFCNCSCYKMCENFNLGGGEYHIRKVCHMCDQLWQTGKKVCSVNWLTHSLWIRPKVIQLSGGHSAVAS